MMILHHPGHYGLEKLDQNRRTRTKEISGLFVGGTCCVFFFSYFFFYSATRVLVCAGWTPTYLAQTLSVKSTYLGTMQSFHSLVNVLKPAVIQSLSSVYWPMGSESVDKSTVLQRFSVSTSEWLHSKYSQYFPPFQSQERNQPSLPAVNNAKASR